MNKCVGDFIQRLAGVYLKKWPPSRIEYNKLYDSVLWSEVFWNPNPLVASTDSKNDDSFRFLLLSTAWNRENDL